MPWPAAGFPVLVVGLLQDTHPALLEEFPVVESEELVQFHGGRKPDHAFAFPFGPDPVLPSA